LFEITPLPANRQSDWTSYNREPDGELQIVVNRASCDGRWQPYPYMFGSMPVDKSSHSALEDTAGSANEEILERLDVLPLTRLHLWVIVLCAAAFAIDLMEVTLGNALSAIFSAAPYRLAPQQVSWLLVSVYVGAIIGAPVMGGLGDRFGLKKILMIVVFWLSATSLLGATSPSPLALMGFRFLSGIALGAIPPLMIAYLTDISPIGRRGLVVFLVCAIAYLAPPAAIFGLRWLTVSRPFGVEAWRWPLAAGGVLAAFVSFAFLYLPEGPRWLLASGQTSYAKSAIDKFYSSRTVRNSPRQAPTPSAKVGRTPYAKLSKKRAVVVGALYFLNPWATIAFPLITGPALLARGFSLTDTLFYVGIATFGPVIGTLLAGIFVDRMSRSTALILCALIMLACTAIFFATRSPVLLATSVIGFGLGTAIYMPVMTVFGAEMFPVSIRASATSIAWAVNRVAAVLAPLLLLPLLHRSATAVAIVVAATLLATICLTLFATRLSTPMASS
jgi:MFS transporter, putative metabolite:H+ symporter